MAPRPSLASGAAIVLASAFVLGSFLAFGTGAVVNPSVTPAQLAASMATASVVVDGASFVTVPGGTPYGVDNAPLGGFPRDGTTFALLSTGNAQHARNPNNSDSTSTGNGGGHVNGNSNFDVVIFRVDVTVPPAANCLTVDFQFFSEEFPEYVGSAFNDAFLAELDVNDWTVAGADVSAPHNFAFDAFGNPITINAAGAASMTAENAAGTTYDGATPVLRATTPVTPGAHALFFTIFDMGDGGYDSTVFLDRLFTGTAGPGGCEEGAAPPDLDPPAPPQALSATADYGLVALAWQAPASDGGSPLSQYVVYRFDASTANWAVRGTVPPETPSFLDSADHCTPYAYRVTAVNGEGESAPSDEASATTPCAPSAPVLSAGRGPEADQVTLAWTEPAGDVTTYRVYLLEAEGPTPIGEPTEPTFTHDAGFCRATSYVVSAINPAGEGAPSNVAGATTLCVPDVPTDPRLSLANAQTVLVEWGAPAGGEAADGYRVYRLDGDTSTLKGDVDAATFQFLDTLGTCATGTYVVVAHNGAGEGPGTTPQSITTTCPPGVPGDLDAMPGPALGQLTITWTAPISGDPVTGYEIYGSAPGGPTTLLATVPPEQLSFTETGLDPGVPRCYQVIARNEGGSSAPSNEDCATTFAAPSPPTGLTPDVGITAVGLTWGPPENDGGRPVLHYEVYRSDPLHDAAPLGTTTGPPFVDEVPSCSPFTYSVVAVNEVGSGGAATVDVMTPCPPSPPLDFLAVGAIRRADLAWSEPFSDGGRPILGYRAIRTETGSPPVETTLPPEARSHTDALADCASYDYALVAFNAVGDSAPATDPAATPCAPGAPASLVASRGPGLGEITIEWTAPDPPAEPPVTAYRLYAGATPESLEELDETPASTFAYLHAGLGHGTQRCYQVSAVNDVGEGDRSSLECARTFGRPEPPVDLTARSGPDFGQVSLSWSPPGDDGGRTITSYFVYRGAAPDDLDLHRIVGAEATEFLDQDLEDGVHFFYAVSARNDAGEGSRSNPAHGASFTRQSESQPEPLPAGVAETGAVWQGQYAYVVGGLQGSDGERTSTNAIVRFDPSTGESETVEVTLPTPRHDVAALWVPGSPETGGQSCHPACAFGGIAYIFGGDWDDGTHVGAPASCHPACFAGTEILRYIPDEGTLEPIDNELPEAAAGAAGVVIEETHVGVQSCHPACMIGLGFLFGGEKPQVHAGSPVPESCHPACAAGFHDEILSFDPDGEVLTTMSARLPTPRTQMSAVAAGDGYVYLFGGMDESGDLDDILRYDPANDVLVTLEQRLPSPRQRTSAFWDGHAAYVIGGTSDGVRLDEIVRFDPADGTVSSESSQLPSGRDGTSVVFDGDTAHIFGGDDGDETLDEVVQFRPTAPQNPNARPQPNDPPGSGPHARGSTTTGAGRILVTWEPPANAPLAPVIAYNVYRSTAPDEEVLHATVPAGSTSFLDGGLPRASTFYYKVSAVSGVGEGPQSDEVSATTTDIPTAPRELRALPGGVGSVALSWQAPSSDGGETLRAYRVYRSTSGLGSGITMLGEVPAAQTTFQDGGCRLGTFCTYIVAAVNVHGQGPLSNTASAPGTKL